MDRKQKEQLRFLLKARKRADKVLAKRREAERIKQEHQNRLANNQELMKQYAQQLTDLARECGMLSMAEGAALQRGGSLAQDMSYYVDYGMSSSNLQHAIGVADKGVLCASHLALRITWEAGGALNEAEIRVHKNGSITFHNNILPVFPLIWRIYPAILQKMLASAMNHPHTPAAPPKPNT